MKQIELIKDVFAQIQNDGFTPVGNWGYRVIVRFMSKVPQADSLLKEYYVWFSKEYLQLNKIELIQDSIENYALEITNKKLVNSNNQIPIENGISFGIDYGEIIVDPKDYQPIV